MPDPQDETPAVLNLDTSVTLMGIYQALMAYAGTIPDMGVAEVLFEQSPAKSARFDWTATAKLKCFGDIKTEVSDLSADEVNVLTNLEPLLIHEQTWTAKGPGFAGAVEELRERVESFLRTLRTRREQDIVAANKALQVLANPDEYDLQAFWPAQATPEEHGTPQKEE